MTVRKVWVLRGPNIWARFPVLEAWVDLGDFKSTPPAGIPGFSDRLSAWLTTVARSRPGRKRLDGVAGPGTSLADAMARAALALQAVDLVDLDFGQARPTAEEGIYRVAVQYQDEEFGRACVDAAVAICLAAATDRPFDADAEARRLHALYCTLNPWPHMAAFVAAARVRGIPVQRLGQSAIGNIVLFGHGVKQRRILAARTDRTGAIAESISGDKGLTKSMLAAVGVPVPEGEAVASAQEAWQAAREVGLPVVVKPKDADYGIGVSLNLGSREQVVAAYEKARARGAEVLVERYVAGDEHRVLVVGGRVVAVARRDPPQVVGDGLSTVAGLVEEVNGDPRRGDGRTTPLYRIELDEAALATLGEQGLAPDSVPPAGARVLIRRNAHRWVGGTVTDVTDRIHPDVAARAVEAARVIGLDVAGLDVVAADIGRPLEEQGGVVIEVNAEPSLVMHLRPTEGRPRPVCEAILATLFPEGEEGRIPIVAVTGTNGKTTTTRLIAHLLREAGRRVGMTCTDGIYFDGRRIETGDCSGPHSARTALLNPLAEVAVLETARGGILTGGLGFDRCDVAVVTNLGEGDHVGRHDVHTVDEMAEVKRTVVEVVAPGGAVVLNADDPLVATMAAACQAPAIFFSRAADNPIVARHRDGGGKALLARGGAIVLAEGDREEALVGLDRVPMTHGGRAGFQVENVLAATAAAWALGIPRETIRDALETFACDVGLAPGRFNVLVDGGKTIVIDYAHNASALDALARALEEFPDRRRLIVYSGAGSRRDEDIVRQGQILGAGFDRVILYEDQCNYGRPDGEVIGLLRRGLGSGPRASEVSEVRGEFRAIEAALNSLRPGELAVIAPESIEEAIAFVRGHLDTNQRAQENSA